MKVEFFSANCRLCERTLNTLKVHFPEIEIEIHRASECKDGSCCILAEKYKVRAVPSLVIDEKVIFTGLPTEDDLNSLAKVLRAG